MQSFVRSLTKGSMTYIFIYGTLKKGQPNYYRMTDGSKGKAEYCGKGYTLEKYPLVIAGEYNIPFLLNVPGLGHHITGEIYSVNSQMLQYLDEFEGCPDWYQRTPVRITVVEWEGKNNPTEGSPPVNSIQECFVYCTTTYQPEWMKSPFYDNYDSYGNHGLQYVVH